MSAQAFHSPSWYRLANMRPALKPQAEVRRQSFRGQPWHVVRDRASGRFHRLTPSAYQLLGLLDGERTMDQVWEQALHRLGDDTPGQEEIIQLLAQLHGADLLHCEVSPDSAELLERFARNDGAHKAGRFKNPLSIKFPLWDPDRFLDRSLPWIKPVLGWWGAAVYLVVVMVGLLLAGLHWVELTGNVEDRVLATGNLVILWLCFPVVKFLHEMGHAYAVKAGGGEVHEMGVMLLVFMPVPYVDASAASGMRSKWARAGVGAAGMGVELFIAALFMVLWTLVEPGLLRAVAFNVLLIAGVSTVVFNANPLLRFDGYYIFSDLVEIPNLAARGTRYWRYLFERYAFRMQQAEAPLASPGERAWFLAYTPAALVYRVMVSVGIVLYIAGEWFFIGVVLALWGVAAMIVMPLGKLISYLMTLPRSGRTRRRALTFSLSLLFIAVALLFVVPAPARLQAEGVVWLPDEASVRAQSAGFVTRLLVPVGTQVAAGVPLVESADSALVTDLQVARARITELEARLDQQRFTERVEAEITRQELVREQARLDRVSARVAQLVSYSQTAGRFVVERPSDLPGRYVKQGDSLGYLVQDVPRIVRVAVSQDDVDLVRKRLVRIEVRAAESLDAPMAAQLVREVPAARDHVPSAALSSEGGGAFAADPRDPHSGKTLATTFQFDLQLPPDAPTLAYGGRVHVRFSFEPEPLGQGALRRVRQAFLARFHV
ncbi:MAG TPA: hypothetical protein VLJ86_12320 [Ramlibacter sp.]|nr:hypothetical protein [Ramlibacter sp.]